MKKEYRKKKSKTIFKNTLKNYSKFCLFIYVCCLTRQKYKIFFYLSSSIIIDIFYSFFLYFFLSIFRIFKKHEVAIKKRKYKINLIYF